MWNSHRHPNTFHVFPSRTEYFKNSFFQHVNNEWNKLDPNIRRSTNHNFFCNALMKFIMPVEMKIFIINVSFGIKMLTKLKLVFRHLRDHKFRQGFRVTLNPFCSCSIEAETTKHYSLRFHFYNPNHPYEWRGKYSHFLFGS